MTLLRHILFTSTVIQLVHLGTKMHLVVLHLKFTPFSSDSNLGVTSVGDAIRGGS